MAQINFANNNVHLVVENIQNSTLELSESIWEIYEKMKDTV